MALINLKTDLSKIKKLFGSDTKTAGKTKTFPYQSLEYTPTTGPSATANQNVEILESKRKGLEDRFYAGVPEPNRNFGKLVNQTTPTVPTTMEGTLVKSISVIDSNWTAFQNIVNKESVYSTLGIANRFPDTHATGFTLHAENFDTFYKGPSPVYGSLGIANRFPDTHATGFTLHAENFDTFYKGPSSLFGTLEFANRFPNTHATGFTGYRTFGDPRFPEGSEYIGIGSYNNPGRLWFGTTPKGQLHKMWESNFPTLDTHPHDAGISNPYYSSRDKLYSATETYTDDRGSYYLYFKRNESELNIGGRGTLASAWDHGSVKLSIDDTGVPTIETNQYTKHSKPKLFTTGLMSFTSFPDIPSKTDAYPPGILTFPRGGPVLTVKRGLKDIERHAKWLLTPKGAISVLIQVGLQLLNTRPETRIWNPLSLGSIIPTIHIKRHLGLNLGINTQDFGPHAGTVLVQMVGDPIKVPGSVGSSFGEGPGSYTGAQDYKDMEHPVHSAITGGSMTQRSEKSRLVSHLSAFFTPIEGKFDEKLILSKRKSIGQSLYLVPGGKGIFGADVSRDVYSQHHLSSGGRIGKSIHESSPDTVVSHGIPSLGKYKTLAYGDLKRLEPDSTGSLGTPSQFSGQHYERIESTGKLEYRYKFGSPGMPGKDRTDPLGGVNAKDVPDARYDTLDLLGVQGYISSGNSNPNALLVDGTKLNIDNIKPLSGDYPDLIPLQFYDITNKAWIIFRAYVGKFNDTITPSWGSTDIAGRSQPMYYYQKTERKVSFDFKVAATSKWELAPMWQKLNYLVGLCYPSFTGKAYPTMINPFIKLTLGDVFHHVPGFLTSLTVSPIENIPWEIINDPKKGLARVPMGVTVSLDFTYVGDALGQQLSPNHYIHALAHSWVNYADSYWQKGGAYPKSIQEPVPISKGLE